MRTAAVLVLAALVASAPAFELPPHVRRLDQPATIHAEAAGPDQPQLILLTDPRAQPT